MDIDSNENSNDADAQPQAEGRKKKLLLNKKNIPGPGGLIEEFQKCSRSGIYVNLPSTSQLNFSVALSHSQLFIF